MNEADTMHRNDKSNPRGVHCGKTEQNHQVAATSLQARDERRLQRVHLTFPDGITCKAFNNGDGRKAMLLKNMFQFVETKIGEKIDDNGRDKIDITWEAPHVFWVLTVEREARHLKKQDEDDDDFLFQATEGVSGMNMG
jgi:hypothetical protein